MRMVQGLRDADFQAVIGQADVGREQAFGAGVREVVTDVGEEGAAGGEFADGFGGALDGGVSGVGFVAEGVEEEHVEAAEFLHGAGGDFAVVGEIGGIAEAEAVDGSAPWRMGTGGWRGRTRRTSRRSTAWSESLGT